jgi:hypothetical protein
MYSFLALRSRTPLIFLTSIVCFLLLSTVAGWGQQEDFSIVVLPDPQNYSEFYPAIFTQQTQWVVDHRAEHNIQMVIGVGDMVNHWDSTTEWSRADAAIDLLDANGIPYAMAIGNHDYDNFRPSSRGAGAFNEWFGPGRYSAYPWYRGNYNNSNENFYVTMSAGGTEYLILVLEFHPRDAVLTWAESVLVAFPDHPVIVVTHSYMYVDDTRVDRCDVNDISPSNGNDGDMLWEKFASRHENIFLVLGGHISRKAQSKRVDPGANGRLVMETLQNWQDYPNGGDGWLRLYKFHPASNSVEVFTYSPYRESTGRSAWLTDAENQFSFPINAHASTASGTGTVKGRLRAARTGSTGDCKGISGATVSAGGAQATTDTNGVYSLAVSAPQTHTVSTDPVGWKAASKSSTVWPDMTDQLEFFLTAVSESPTGTCSTTTSGVKICAPADGSTVASPFAVQAAAHSTVPIKYMQVYLDGVAKTTQYVSNLDVQVSAGAGTHRLTVLAKDNNGVILKTSETITVGSSTPPPSGSCTAAVNGVTICAPTEGATLGSPVTVTAAAKSTAAIKFMQVYVDGVAKTTIYASSISTPVSMGAGAHRVTVQAKDVNGVIVKSSVNINVQ